MYQLNIGKPIPHKGLAPADLSVHLDTVNFAKPYHFNGKNCQSRALNIEWASNLIHLGHTGEMVLSVVFRKLFAYHTEFIRIFLYSKIRKIAY